MSLLMRTALLFRDGNFVGREYFAALQAAGLAPDLVVPVGQMEAESLAIEVERTGGNWNPKEIPEDAICRRFERIGDPELPTLLNDEGIDVAIQGGVGILKGVILASPRIGWLNVHPGKLPQYRGNSCPEWAVLSGDPVYASAHFIDEGIDTGPVLYEGRYEIGPNWTYFDFRANLYRHCAAVLVAAIRKLAASVPGESIAQQQSAQGARYWPSLDQSQREAVRGRFPLAS